MDTTKKFACTELVLKSVNEDARIFEGIASTPNPDRSGDIVEPKGAQYKLPLPLLWMHNPSKPVGFINEVKVSNDGIHVKGNVHKFDEPGILKDQLDLAWHSLKSKLVRGLSIGFTPIEAARIKDTFSFHFLKWDWLELSMVTIPANADAGILSIKSADFAIRRALQKSVVYLDDSAIAQPNKDFRKSGVVYLND